ncbi:zinc-binding dehydrogenase [Lactobacillus xylocopicola]|uniref:Alcohol dehydrogenase-like C-terminal domain-containing protein n=1 Tax=Lactobacillus xylocopicola TaxID=2976676 RepID=A0ABM8BIN7_9LACO|nr:zinc-binding dehydrogenase [Lactobacillus xylocopicola]BDR61181.1 hypothetical protein KIM322_14420 [Lactobacillus xylocopicola]
MTAAGTVLNALKPEVNSNLVVLGTGSVGLAAIMGAAVSNCNHVIAVDKNDMSLNVAKEFGATDVINNTKVDLIEAINKIVGPAGLNYVVDTTGEPEVMKQGLTGQIFVHTYPSTGTMLTTCTVFGQIAGKQVADYVRKTD